MGKFSIFVVGLMTLAGCSQAVDHKGKTPLVEVGHEFLYNCLLYTSDAADD